MNIIWVRMVLGAFSDVFGINDFWGYFGINYISSTQTMLRDKLVSRHRQHFLTIFKVVGSIPHQIKIPVITQNIVNIAKVHTIPKTLPNYQKFLPSWQLQFISKILNVSRNKKIQLLFFYNCIHVIIYCCVQYISGSHPVILLQNMLLCYPKVKDIKKHYFELC
jgi:hypothetical protein